MKNRLLCCLLAAFGLLASFGAQAGARDLQPSPYGENDFHINEKIRIDIDYPYWDYLWFEPDFTTIPYTIKHWSDSTPGSEFSEAYSVEYIQDGAWYVLPLSEDVIFRDYGYGLVLGETMDFEIRAADFDWDWPEGDYRLVKIINGKPRQTPFRLAVYPERWNGLWPTLHAPEEIADDGEVVLQPEESYPRDAEKMMYRARAAVPGGVGYGVDYEVEILHEDIWYRVPFPEGMSWIQPLLWIEEGWTEFLYIEKSIFAEDFDWPAGTYRLVKEFNRKLYSMEFAIEE